MGRFSYFYFEVSHIIYERTIYFVLLLTLIINKTHHVKYSKRQQGCCEVTGLGSLSQAVTLKAKASTIQLNTNNGALLSKTVSIKKKKRKRAKAKKTTGTAVKKQVKKKEKNWQKYTIRVIGKKLVTNSSIYL